ncbi:hypothetical protein ES703_30962 [subsurface metagenome]
MHFGEDWFKTIQFVMAILRLIARIFGDKDDKKFDDEIQGNDAHEVEKIINTTHAAKTNQG